MYSKETNYDFRWKEIIEALFEDFVAYFMPSFYPKVDFKKGVEFLDKELQELVGTYGKKGYIVTDKLVKVHLKDGSIKWLVIHIEIQSTDESNFSERMFVYFSRLYEKYNKRIIAIAVYTGAKVPKNYDEFVYELEETKLTYQFAAYRAKEKSTKELKASNNPFALAVLAGKYVQQTKQEELSLYRAKLELVRLARDKNYDSQRIKALIKFIVYLIELPTSEIKFQKQVRKMINSENMERVTPKQKASFKGFADAVFEGFYGKSYDKMMEQIIVKLLQKEDLSIKEIAEIVEVSEYHVRKIKKGFDASKK